MTEIPAPYTRTTLQAALAESFHEPGKAIPSVRLYRDVEEGGMRNTPVRVRPGLHAVFWHEQNAQMPFINLEIHQGTLDDQVRVLTAATTALKAADPFYTVISLSYKDGVQRGAETNPELFPKHEVDRVEEQPLYFFHRENL